MRRAPILLFVACLATTPTAGQDSIWDQAPQSADEAFGRAVTPHYKRWAACVHESATRYASGSDAAPFIAKIAVADCQVRRRELYQAMIDQGSKFRDANAHIEKLDQEMLTLAGRAVLVARSSPQPTFSNTK